MQLNFRDLVTVGLIVAAFIYGPDLIKNAGKPTTDPAAPTAVAAPAGSASNYAHVLRAIADNVDLDGKALRPVILWTNDAGEAVERYFDRPFAANIKASYAQQIAALKTQVVAAGGGPNVELATDKRAAVSKLLRDTAAGVK
jgi:hypothetical protein